MAYSSYWNKIFEMDLKLILITGMDRKTTIGFYCRRLQTTNSFRFNDWEKEYEIGIESNTTLFVL